MSMKAFFSCAIFFFQGAQQLVGHFCHDVEEQDKMVVWRNIWKKYIYFGRYSLNPLHSSTFHPNNQITFLKNVKKIELIGDKFKKRDELNEGI